MPKAEKPDRRFVVGANTELVFGRDMSAPWSACHPMSEDEARHYAKTWREFKYRPRIRYDPQIYELKLVPPEVENE